MWLFFNEHSGLVRPNLLLFGIKPNRIGSNFAQIVTKTRIFCGKYVND